MDEKLIMEEQIELLKESIKKLQNETYDLEQIYYDKFKKIDYKEKFLDTYWKYKNNSYSCPESPKDYWNVYYYVFDVVDGILKVIKFEKDSEGKIQIHNGRTENPEWFPNSLRKTTKKEFNNKFKELFDEIVDIKKICNIN